MSLGDIAALIAVTINLLAYVFGVVKIKATVESLDRVVVELKNAINRLSDRLGETENHVSHIKGKLGIE